MNWFEYIDYLLFNTNVLEKRYENEILYIRLSNNVEFNLYVSEDGTELYDILYWNNDSINESEEFGFYFKTHEPTEPNKNILKNIFNVPINMGWTDVHYLSNKNVLLKIDRYYGIGKSIDKNVSYSFIISRFNLILSFIVRCQTKIIEIEPAYKM